ncbi:DUF3604 domain-containing protein [Pseudomaricurvus hydrocarbonicus]|uniref:DUF3604 domain-containing protein n=1 Tax=Pseudomaricurvus hydrocarbonicus TaxID=1470433 RepID=UPI001AA08C1D
MFTRFTSLIAAVLISALWQQPSVAATDSVLATTPMTSQQPFSPSLRTPAENQLFWGDLHLHTNLSTDAYINGSRSIGQEEAYRFAMGETVTSDIGIEAKLNRPLDFLAVTDHGENLGLYARIEAGDPLVVGQPVGDRYAEVLDLFGKVGLRNAFMQVIGKHGPMPDMPTSVLRSIWSDVTQIADRYNQPGQFTTLIGYEWTSMINGDNLHRVVLFRDDADLTSQVLPIDANENPDPESLWAGLAHYEEATGGQVLAIPHNGNLSNGRMFSPQRVNGDPIDRRYAENRMRWEPVYEVTQMKGDGESHPTLSPTDEFANFETWDTTNVAFSTPKEPWMLRYEYARSALKDGLEYDRTLGANPFKMGLVGGTDTHTGLATTREDNYFGKFKGSNPSAERLKAKMGGQFQSNLDLGASGLTGVWARENSREAIFDALRRREVYATSGSRIRLRFFGGWNFQPEDVTRADYARYGYRSGVPMGSNLPARENANAPSFMIHAVRDPDAANLDRVQVIKGWLDDKGQSHEKVYNVALSDGRTADRKGRVQPLKSTVDVAKATYSNSTGDPELISWWQDPEFDPLQPAFYYVRVLEIPTPRWTTYDAAYFDTELPESVPVEIQDRAYSSPIWYQP